MTDTITRTLWRALAMALALAVAIGGVVVEMNFHPIGTLLGVVFGGG